MNPGFEELEICSIKTNGSSFKGVSGHRIACDEHGDGLFVVGGWNPSFTAPNSENDVDRRYVREIWKFNVARRSWSQLRCADPPISMASHCLTSLGRTANGGPPTLLMFGGSLSPRGQMGNSNQTYLYYVGEERWERLATTGRPPGQENGHWFGQAMAKRGNQLYVASGRCVGIADRVEIHRLNLATLVWEELNVRKGDDVPKCRVRHEIVVDENEKIYVLGGAIDFIAEAYDLKSIPYFDTAIGRWSTLHTLPDSTAGFPKPRSCFGAVIFENNVYIVGGYFRGSWDGNHAHPVESEVLDDLWRLHLATGKWTKYSLRLPRPLWFHAVDVDDDGVMYVFGGCVEEDYRAERTTQLWSIKLVVPTLKRLAWDKILKCCAKNVAKLTGEEICEKLALPAGFLVPKLNF